MKKIKEQKNTVYSAFNLDSDKHAILKEYCDKNYSTISLLLRKLVDDFIKTI